MIKVPLNTLRKIGRSLSAAVIAGSLAGVANAEVDLVAWWPLDEVGATTTPDKSGNGLDLNLEGDIDSDSLTAGKFDMAIEFDASLSNEEKTPHMIEWWTRAHNRIAGTKMSRSALREFVATADVECR